MQRQKLYRSSTDNILGGVCGGVAKHLDIDSTIIRLIVVATALFGGAGVVFYVIAWIIIPDEPSSESIRHSKLKEEVTSSEGEIIGDQTQRETTGKNDNSNSSKTLGWILILVGAFLFINIWFPYVDWGKFLPFVFVFGGLYLLIRSQKGKDKEE
ncbi:MAG: hypothetical protein APF76_18300 [Desulfitibacter sp. BRH_c19]|nr:MAG: hypothetical protein APF76_18300 [Desulfitibacter sp. BRH_c19]